MKIFAETPRLLLREMAPEDAAGMFELDSNPEVHRYLGTEPVKTLEESSAVIEFVRRQYAENGIGRWAVIEKESGRFIGWAGLKLFRTEMNGRIDFYDLGYRYIPKYWGKGYASEAAKASWDYAFNVLKLKELFAMAYPENIASNKVLVKTGFYQTEIFELEGMLCNWYTSVKPE